MNRLFAELYTDEDVSVLVAELLRVRGFSAVTTLEAGNLNASDEEQLEFAVAGQKIMLTHNRDDFVALAENYFATGQKHYGIIVAVRRPPQQIVARLLAILNQTTADEMINQLLYI